MKITTHAMQGLAITIMLAASPHAMAQEAGKKLYCWNENGRKVCGDALPADAVDNARREFNAATGSQTGRLPEAPTDAERAAMEAAQAEARRLAVAAAKRQRREQAMVESYATVGALQAAYQTRVELMDAAIKASTLGVAGLRTSLLGLLQRAGTLELAAKPVPDDLATNIRTRHLALQTQRETLAGQKRERAVIDAERASALARYREIKGLDPATPPEPSTTPGQTQAPGEATADKLPTDT